MKRCKKNFQEETQMETDEKKCKMGALKILRKITIHSGVRQQITVMGGIELTINLLR